MADFDPDMINDFIDEAQDLLQTIEDDILLLEKPETASDETINRLFRAVHTIKGTSGFIGLRNITSLSHIMENIMAQIRDKTITANSLIIDAMLAGADKLKELINDVYQSNNKDISQQINNLQQALDALQGNNKAEKQTITNEKKNTETTIKMQNQEQLDDEIVTAFVAEANALMHNTEQEIMHLEQLTDVDKMQPHIKTIYQTFNVIKGSAKMIGLHQIADLALHLESIIADISKENKTPDEVFYKVFYQGFDKLQTLLDDVCFSNQADIAAVLYEINDYKSKAKQKIKKIDTDTGKTERSEQSVSKFTEKEVNGFTEYKKTQNGDTLNYEKAETVRLNVQTLDKLMRLAGELVLIRNQQLVASEASEPLSRSVVQRLDTITSNIQETIMQTRLQPMGNIFSKFPRIIRDLSKKLDKKIELKVSGDDVELDKTILEALTAPITHLIRNSADHGIEHPDQREQAGKSPTGTIELKAFHEGGLVNIIIRDDGKGINAEIIKQKAIESGIKTKAEVAEMNSKDVLALVTHPGFSTASDVTDISGRGVGMDVVKANVEKLNGSIEIRSAEGKGTEILLRLPLTLAIIPCLIVETEGYHYAVPQVNLEELVLLKGDEICRKIESTGDQEVFRLRNKLLPLVRLNEVLNRRIRFSGKVKLIITNYYKKLYNRQMKNNEVKNQTLYFAVLSTGNNRYGLLFDKVSGNEEIVVKPMHACIRNLKIFSGSTILGDGKVALILDADGIANHACVDFNLIDKSEIESEIKKLSSGGKIESLLLFKSGVQEQYAIPVSLIKRIEEVKSTDIEVAGSKEFITVNNETIRILRLEENMNVSPCVQQDELFLLLLKHIKKPIGVLFSKLIDIQDVLVNINTQALQINGLLGTEIVNKKMTLFLDIYKLLEMAEPEWFEQKQIDYEKYSENIPVSETFKILLVDDSSVFRQMVEQYLVDDGYEVVAAENGVQALMQLQKQQFHLLISDLEMPEKDGFELIQEVRSGEEQPNIPAIALSSLNNPKIIQHALDTGYNAYEVKVDRERLLKLISKLLYPKSKEEYIKLQ